MKLTPEYIASQVLTCEFDYNGTYTVCTITTRHGSKHVGTSGCLDPANYNREIGEQIAHKNALDQLWALEGYFFSKLGLGAAPGVLVNDSSIDVFKTEDYYPNDRWYQSRVEVSLSLSQVVEAEATGGYVKAPVEAAGIPLSPYSDSLYAWPQFAAALAAKKEEPANVNVVHRFDLALSQQCGMAANAELAAEIAAIIAAGKRSLGLK